MSPGRADAFRPPSPEDATRWRALLTDAGYTAEGLQESFGTAKPPLPEFGLRDQILEDLGGTERDILLRWFFLGEPVAAAAARAALPSWFLEIALETGMLRDEGESLRPACILAAHEDLLLASDPYARLLSPDAYDHVLTVNPAAVHLLHFTVRRRVRSALDLCAGSGIQALAAASHAERVVAADLNPRAAGFLALNGRLNGRENIEVRTGDLFDPVKGRSFELIVCNPPFVLAPSSEFLYRDNDLGLDELCRRIVRQAPAHLEEGGFFQMICEWPQIGGVPWDRRIAGWFEGLGCDVWALKGTTQQPPVYAAGRVQETLPGSREEAAARYRGWMAFFREAGIEAIHAGLVVLRRRSGANWVRLDESPGSTHGPFGEHVLQGFATRDFLEACPGEEALLAARLRLTEHARLDLSFEPGDDGWKPVSSRLRLERGLPHRVAVLGDVATFIAGLDGTSCLGDRIAAMLDGVPAGTDVSRMRGEVLRTMRFLLDRGFLSVVSPPPASR
ncbi:MAG: class I SAM-dependent methyltransferase [Acidobacteriota bacterium]